MDYVFRSVLHGGQKCHQCKYFVGRARHIGRLPKQSLSIRPKRLDGPRNTFKVQSFDEGMNIL